MVEARRGPGGMGIAEVETREKFGVGRARRRGEIKGDIIVTGDMNKRILESEKNGIRGIGGNVSVGKLLRENGPFLEGIL